MRRSYLTTAKIHGIFHLNGTTLWRFLHLDGLIKRKGAGYVVEKRKQSATPSNTSALDDLEDTAVEDTAVFETAPPTDRTHDTLEQFQFALYFLLYFSISLF